jgi:hypothetical protein
MKRTWTQGNFEGAAIETALIGQLTIVVIGTWISHGVLRIRLSVHTRTSGNIYLIQYEVGNA